MILFIILSVPIGITMGISTALCLWMFSDVSPLMLAQKSATGLDSFPLLAIPFFILAGSLMCEGGIARRIVNLADKLVGFVTGGLAMVTVMACMFYAAISGSAPATVSAIGSFMIPAMKERKYDAPFAAAITAASGTIGVIIPPSIPFVIYCVVAQASIGDMFIGGIIPGIMLGGALMTVCWFTAKKRGYVSSYSKINLGELWKAFREAVLALMVPVIILGGIYSGVFTPTEAAVVAVVYSILVGRFVYKELSNKAIYECFRTCGLINGALEFMIGLSMAFAAYLAMEQIPAAMAKWLISISDSKFVILLVINVILLILGCFVDNIAAVIILTPILLPVVKNLGMHPIHFGLIITVNLACGFVSPPYGINLFVASAISGESIEKISMAVLPSFIAMVICLMLFTYFPIFTMGLVQLAR
ncbi:MAG: TRAP transporter large permease subunit [Synergistaceae bacterium]|jgi:C4-dicarboxylate transporter DctM subunit|nr:TRAP transporter large permease subunit [Synergistaceae bacterium]